MRIAHHTYADLWLSQWTCPPAHRDHDGPTAPLILLQRFQLRSAHFEHRLVDDAVPAVMDSVLCPIIAIAVVLGTPARSRFLTAVRRKSCGMRSIPASLQASRHGS